MSNDGNKDIRSDQRGINTKEKKKKKKPNMREKHSEAKEAHTAQQHVSHGIENE